ncbi:hypothetical protein OH687_23025 [Burkholderia anthina]|nr:hypothetical protein OH687_23025 [Burkholderia anthina]
MGRDATRDWHASATSCAPVMPFRAGARATRRSGRTITAAPSPKNLSSRKR